MEENFAEYYEKYFEPVTTASIWTFGTEEAHQDTD